MLIFFATGALAQEAAVSVALTAIFVPLLVILAIYALCTSIYVVKQKEVIIIERLGKYLATKQAGVHVIVPFIDRPKRYSTRYYLSDSYGNSVLKQELNSIRISTQTEVLDFPKQQVITRDNAAIFLDAVLSYKVVNPKAMIYSVQNLPSVLSKLLQAQLRSVAGSLEVDQIIEESSSLHVLTGLLDADAMRWGVKINFVKVQRVEAPGLQDVLAKKKNADLHNKEVIIGAKANKQTTVIESEGKRDSMIKTAEGSAQEILSRARGDAQATINFANAEARSIKEIARAIKSDGVPPTKYLLSVKYIDMLGRIVSKGSSTDTKFLPKGTSFVQTAQDLGFNSIIPNVRGKM